MITPEQLHQYWTILQADMPEIKRIECISDENELAELLNDHQMRDNIMLVSLDPSYSTRGDSDSFRWENICGLFIVTKFDYSDGRTALREAFASARALGKKIAERMLWDKNSGGGIHCNFLSHLVDESIQMDPVRMNQSLNGFYLEFKINSLP